MNNSEVDSRQWWVERWLELLDSYRFKKRLERGRNYAREGNVLSIEFKDAQVVAQVQGSVPEPYVVTLSLDLFSAENWDDVVETMSEKAIFLAELLAGSMPPNMEKVFIANGLSLFPYNLADVHSLCTCPDQANPCKHIAAVYYQLGDRFSEDPFVLFQLRGRTKEQIFAALRDQRVKTAPTLTNPVQNASVDLQPKSADNQASLVDFWRYEEPLESSLVVITPTAEGKKVFDVLGNMPLPFAEAEQIKLYLKQVYQAASSEAINRAINS